MLVDCKSMKSMLHMLRDLGVDKRIWFGIFAIPRDRNSQGPYSNYLARDLNIDTIQLTDCVPTSYRSNRHTPSRLSVLLTVSYKLFSSFLNPL